MALSNKNVHLINGQIPIEGNALPRYLTGHANPQELIVPNPATAETHQTLFLRVPPGRLRVRCVCGEGVRRLSARQCQAR